MGKSCWVATLSLLQTSNLVLQRACLASAVLSSCSVCWLTLLWFLCTVTTEYVSGYPVWTSGRAAGQPFVINGTIHYPEETLVYPFPSIIFKLQERPDISTIVGVVHYLKPLLENKELPQKTGLTRTVLLCDS